MTLALGGVMDVHLQPEFCVKELEPYQPETMAVIANWVDRHPGGVFVDIGCSHGYFACGVLFRDSTARVLAIDVIGIDHEEHWLCTRTEDSKSALFCVNESTTESLS